MQNNGLNPEMMNNIKNLVDNGNISEAISKISPEMIENFSKIMSNSNSNKNDESTNNTSNNQNSNNSQNTYNSSKNSSSNNFDFNNIDMNTILKMKSVMEKMNNSNDPRSNLLYSLKPYLRESRKSKVDQYIKIFSMGKVFEAINPLGGDKKNDV